MTGRNDARLSRTARIGAGVAALLAVMAVSPVKPAPGSGSNARSPSSPQPAPICSGNAGNLLYPLDAAHLGEWTLALPSCDDCSSPATPLGFTFSFYGDSYGEAFVNNNGNLSFGAGLEPFWPTGFPDGRYSNLAGFYADADTRENPEPAVPADVYRRLVDGNGDGVPETFVATWRDVGFYEKSFERRNTFQIAISDGTNLEMGLGNNVCFSYDTMCWTTGRFDGGVGGFGDVPAVVGANRGDGALSFYLGRFDEDGEAYDGPNGDPGGVHFLDGRTFCFSTATTTGNVCPVGLDAGSASPMNVTPGQSVSRSFRFASPEAGQITSLLVDDPQGAQAAGLVVSATAGNLATVALDWTPTCDALGAYPLVLHATDDAATPCTTNASLSLVVSCDDGDPCTKDQCLAGLGCTHDRTSCDDGNTCTDDSCDPAGGCVHAPNSAPCDDGVACTSSDHCEDGRCVGGSGTSCDDGNPCTDDSCNPSGGCVHTGNRASCDDGNACTTRDRCSAGSCVGSHPARCDDHDSCTRDSCDPIQGCVHLADDEDRDGVCDRRDVCDGSVLTPTVVVGSCDSGVPNTFFPFGCTIADFLDACEERRGCPHSNAARCVDQTLDFLRRVGILDRSQARAIERCYRARG